MFSMLYTKVKDIYPGYKSMCSYFIELQKFLYTNYQASNCHKSLKVGSTKTCTNLRTDQKTKMDHNNEILTSEPTVVYSKISWHVTFSDFSLVSVIVGLFFIVIHKDLSNHLAEAVPLLSWKTLLF